MPKVGFDQPYPAALEQISDTGWRLLAPIVYHGNRQPFMVPQGQETDLASTPATLGPCSRRTGRTRRRRFCTTTCGG
jgi:hypothetical protein